MHLFMSPHVDIISRGSLTQGTYDGDVITMMLLIAMTVTSPSCSHNRLQLRRLLDEDNASNSCVNEQYCYDDRIVVQTFLVMYVICNLIRLRL